MQVIVYLIHFERPYYHAQHYLGSTRDLARRVEQHRSGAGSPLLAAVTLAGIPWQVVRTWRNAGRIGERDFKRLHCNPSLCPVCCKRAQDRRPGGSRRWQRRKKQFASK